MLFKLFILLGVGVLAVALRSFQSSFSQKAGAIAILLVSYLLVYFVSDSPLLGAIAAVAWFFLQWVEILTRIRTLRLPKEKQLRPKSPPSSDTFPTLNEITREIENEGFVHVNDAGWDWEDYRQFFRLFYKTEDRAQATICLNEQHELSFYYLRISSRTHSGIIWTTWNYPLSYGLKLTPQFRINRQRPDQSFWELYHSHKEYLRQNQVETSVIDPMDEDRIQTEIENDLRAQIAHNIEKGVLKPANESEVKYSWRGMIYLWCQFLLDLVRL